MLSARCACLSLVSLCVVSGREQWNLTSSLGERKWAESADGDRATDKQHFVANGRSMRLGYSNKAHAHLNYACMRCVGLAESLVALMSSWRNTHTLCLCVAGKHKLHESHFQRKKIRCESFRRLGCDDKMSFTQNLLDRYQVMPDRMFHKLTGCISHVHQGISP